MIWGFLFIFISQIQPQQPSPVLIDRIVATVDKQPIALSDIKKIAWIKCLEEYGQACTALTMNKEVLQSARQYAIYEALLLNAASRISEPLIMDAQINARTERLKKPLGTQEQWLAWLAKSKLTENDIKEYGQKTIRIDNYLENRIRLRVNVNAEDILHYRQEHLEETQALFDEEIKKKLQQDQFNQHTQKYVSELIKNAEIRLIGSF